ncbi:hypothetical protein OROGR_004730 [Orobanche gracilis]
MAEPKLGDGSKGSIGIRLVPAAAENHRSDGDLDFRRCDINI